MLSFSSGRVGFAVEARAIFFGLLGATVGLGACGAVHELDTSDGAPPMRGTAEGGATGSGTGGDEMLGATGGLSGTAGSDANGSSAGGRRADGVGGHRDGAGGGGAGGTLDRPGAGGSGTGGVSPGMGGTAGAAVGAGGTPGFGGMVGRTILSIDFVGGFNASGAVAGAPGALPITPAPVMMSTDVAGLKPAANWNSAFGPVGTLSPLTLSDGTSVNVTLVWNSQPTTNRSGVWRLAFVDPRPDAIMMDGYLDPPSSDTPATVAVANLPSSIASRGYDVYVYCMGAVSSSGTRTYEYSIGAMDFSTAQTGPVTTLFPGYQAVTSANPAGNVVVFRGLSGATFTLLAKPGTGNTTRAPVNGIQIVSPPGS